MSRIRLTTDNLDELMAALEPLLAEYGAALSQQQAHALRSALAFAMYLEATGRSSLSDWLAP